jgi:hypothetical protein
MRRPPRGMLPRTADACSPAAARPEVNSGCGTLRRRTAIPSLAPHAPETEQSSES